MIFQDKVRLLSLYNALNGTNYANPEELQIETLQNAVYMNMKAKEMDISKAVQRAVEESIREGILEEFLMKYRAEAIQMSIFEYDEEKELKLIRRDERELGREEGRLEGRQEGRLEGRLEGLAEGIRALVLGYLEDGESEVRILQKLMKLFRIEEAEAKEWIYKVERSDVRLE